MPSLWYSSISMAVIEVGVSPDGPPNVGNCPYLASFEGETI